MDDNFINGKMRRVRRPREVEGVPLDEFIAQNADPVFLLQNEMWEQLYEMESAADEFPSVTQRV